MKDEQLTITSMTMYYNGYTWVKIESTESREQDVLAIDLAHRRNSYLAIHDLDFSLKSD